MSSLKQSLRRIPYWAYLLVFTVICIVTFYMIYRYQAPFSGETGDSVNGHWIINSNTPGGPVDRAGIKVGDTLLTCNGYRVEEWVSSYHGTKAGDTLIFGILRNHKEVGIPVITDSRMSVFPGLYWAAYIIALLVSICSLYLLYKKPGDNATFVFYIYIQLFAIASTTGSVGHPEVLFIFVNVSYIFSSCLLGPVLIHFHLLFPRPFLQLTLIKIFSNTLYSLGMIIFIYSTISYYFNINPFSGTRWQYNLLDRLAFLWMTLTFLLAMAVVVSQFFKVKETLSRNQMLIVFTGSFFGFLTPICHGFFYDYINYIWLEHPHLRTLFNGIGSLIMIGCILIAILRYRIWDIEVFIRKALLYLGATIIIILTYLFLIWIVDRLIISENNFVRFLILGISVIIFLMLRDRIQRLIDRLFHRETYDSATVISDFEGKLAGIYRSDELNQKIFRSLDEIFHFKSFIFSMKKNDLIYQPAYVYGVNDIQLSAGYEITLEVEERLRKSKVFSPEELNKKPPILEETTGELVIPLVFDGQPNGFFICGQKKSERIYSRQDIQVLRLLAQRVVSLLNTAGLYQRDLDRQLMLERERARISQDMHDDIGASLTRISMMSDLVKNSPDVGNSARQWLGQISNTSRGLMEEMNQIIWALNPRNDNLEGLIAYIRRFAFEYLEPTPVACQFDLPEKMPDIALSVELRRNVYLVAREAIHNAVKHASATKIRINLEMNKHGFRIRMMDDGKGFDPGKLEFPGNGLINMKKRMADIGGKLKINSKTGEGTEIDLNVTLR